MLYANDIQVAGLSIGRGRPRKAQGVARASHGASKVLEVPAGAKGRSGHRAQGQLRDVKHEQNKVKGAWPERKGRIMGCGGRGGYRAKGISWQAPRGHSFLPLFQASLWLLWERGILGELAKPCR